MRAMGIPFTAAHGTVRFSFSRYNTMAEVDTVIRAVPPIVAQLRKLSPYWASMVRTPTPRRPSPPLTPEALPLESKASALDV